jgi:hypothetical protein
MPLRRLVCRELERRLCGAPTVVSVIVVSLVSVSASHTHTYAHTPGRELSAANVVRPPCRQGMRQRARARNAPRHGPRGGVESPPEQDEDQRERERHGQAVAPQRCPVGARRRKARGRGRGLPADARLGEEHVGLGVRRQVVRLGGGGCRRGGVAGLGVPQRRAKGDGGRETRVRRFLGTFGTSIDGRADCSLMVIFDNPGGGYPPGVMMEKRA